MIELVFGKCGSGKTTYLKKHIRKSILPCVVIDTLNEYKDSAELDEDFNFTFFKTRCVPQNESELNFILGQIIKIGEYTSCSMNLYIDEIDMWSNTHYIPETLEKCIKFHRHYGLNIYMTVRSPSEIHKKITALCNKFIIYKITEPIYLDYFRQFSLELPDRILKLNQFEFIEYTL